MKYFFFLLFFPFIAFSQSTQQFTEEIYGSDKINGGTYYYEAVIKYQLRNQGMGDIVLQIGIMEYKITGFKKGNIGLDWETSPVRDEFPIVLRNHQADVLFDVFIDWQPAYDYRQIDFNNLKEVAVRQGALDLYYFDKDQVKNIVQAFDLDTNPERIKDLRVKMAHVHIDNDYIGALSSVIDKYERLEREKNQTSSSTTSKPNQSRSKSRADKEEEKKKKEEEEKEKEEEEEKKKKEKERETYDQLVAKNTRKANSLYNQLQSNSLDLYKRKEIIRELNAYQGYLTPSQKQKLQQQRTENSIADTFVALNSIKLNDERVARRNLKVKYKNNSFSSYQFGAEFSNAWNFFYLSAYIHGIYSSIDGWELDESKDLTNLNDGDLIFTTGDGDEEFLSRNENIASFGGGLELSTGIRVDLSKKMALMPYVIGEIGIGSNDYSSLGYGAGLQFEIGRFTLGVEYITSTYNFRGGAGVSDILPPGVIPLTDDIEINENGVIQAEWLSSSTNQLSEVTYRTNSSREEQYNFTKPKLGYFTFSLAFSLN
jgi:hypothetical protein